MDAAIEIEQIDAEGAVDFVFARGQFNEQLFQLPRIAGAQTMNFHGVIAGVRLNVVIFQRAVDQTARVCACKRPEFDPDKFAELFPQVPNRARLIASAKNPNRDALAESPDKARNSWWRQRDVIERDRLAATCQTGQQPVFSLDDVQLVMRPAKLPFESIANAAETRSLLAMKQRTALPHVSEERRFADAGGADEEHVFPLFVKRRDLFRFPRSSGKAERSIHGKSLPKTIHQTAS